MDLNNGKGRKQRKDFVTERQTRNRLNAEMEDYVRIFSSQIQHLINPNNTYKYKIDTCQIRRRHLIKFYWMLIVFRKTDLHVLSCQ